MSARILFGLCFILIVAITPIAAANDIPDWATEKLLAPWYAAFNAQDAEALADMYTSDAQVGDAQGRGEIIANFKADWADTDISCSGVYDGFQIVGKLATGWGYDTCTQSPKSGGESKTVKYRWLAVYERQDDDSWLCSRDTGVQTDD